MKIKAIILSVIFLLTGSGIKIEVSTCCDVFSGVGLSLKDNGVQVSDECCACVKIPNKSSCCHTSSISTVINPILGLQKTIAFSAKQQVKAPIKFDLIQPSVFNYSVDDVLAFNTFDQRELPVPILLKKRVLQI
ncbi:MAG: hypothetical protein V4613_08870 [Bacteroidota bacterium]